MDVVCVFKKGKAVVREADGARALHEQRAAQFVFERLNLVAHRGLRHVERLGRLGKQELRGHLDKAAQLHGVHGSLPSGGRGAA